MFSHLCITEILRLFTKPNVDVEMYVECMYLEVKRLLVTLTS